MFNEQELTAYALIPAQIFGKSQLEKLSVGAGGKAVLGAHWCSDMVVAPASTKPCPSLQKGGPQSNMIRVKELDPLTALNVGTSLAIHISTLLSVGRLTRYWPLAALDRSWLGGTPHP